MGDFRFKDTTANRKIFSLRKRIRAVTGGTGASKTVGILIWLIDYAQSTTDKVVSIVSESYPHLSLGAMREFKEIMRDRGYWEDKSWTQNPTPMYRFPNNTIIEFVSMDSYGKAHGPRRDVLFVNECNNLSWDIVDQLITRTKETVWLDWNPVEDFWFYTELEHREDVDFITLTYLDNEGLDDGQRSEIEAHKGNARWWRVYGLGLKGEIEGRVYTGWKLDVEEIPHEARLERIWLDFGYTNDPTAIGGLYFYNGGYILDEVTYQKGLSNKQIADILTNLPKVMIVADSAEPKSIDELRLYGLSVIPANKGKDSVMHGIQAVQHQRISVTKRSVNIIKEYRNYMFMKDKKTGYIVNEPEQGWDHHMDGIRYAITSLAPVVQRMDFLRRFPATNVEKPNPAR